MADPENGEIDALRCWIGRTEAARDFVAPRLVAEFRATFDERGASPAEGAPAPLGVHWCLTPPIVEGAALGPDGHPARGGFLPPVKLPRRMWAGSAITFHDRLRVGDTVERRSRIADVSLKRGRTGRLCFVAVEHEFATDRGLAVTERQDIVYRDAQSAGQPAAPPAAGKTLPAARWQRERRADPVLLFRYSALTFNGHRIHYDRGYVAAVEGYPGLIVHGPLQATMLLDLAATIRGSAPRHFAFRGLQPLFDFEPFRLCAAEREGGLHLWAATADHRTMAAEAAWQGLEKPAA